MSAGGRAGRLRVLIVTDQYEPMIGGVTSVTRELAQGLAGRGHAVTVLAPGAGWRGRVVRDPGEVTVDYRGSLPWPWYPGQRLGLLPAARGRALISEFAPDVVHAHSPLPLGAAARPASRRLGVPFVYTNHYLPLNVWPAAAGGNGQVGIWRERAFYACVNGFANRCDYVTAPTETALRLLREHGLRAPSRAVSNGVDLERFSPGGPDPAMRARYGLPAGAPVIVSVGRLSREKRADVLIAAMARLEADAVLILAGTGPEAGRLRSLARHYGVADRVLFPGFIPDADLPGLYRLGDVFAIASEAELQSLATMAALASGLPVVAADAGALGELVRPGENGFLARAGNAAEVAGFLTRLVRDPQLRAGMSKASLRIIADHDRHRLLVQWESIYRGLARAGSRKTAEQAKVSDGEP